MLRLLAVVLGGFLLLNGAVDTINPRIGIRLWNWYVRRQFPAPLEQYYVDEQSHVATTAARSLSIIGMIAGLATVLSLVRGR